MKKMKLFMVALVCLTMQSVTCLAGDDVLVSVDQLPTPALQFIAENFGNHDITTIEMEKKKGFDRVIRAVGNTMRITAEDSLIVNHIKEHTPDNSVVFLIGIGKCFPILRSHTVLNNLHQVVDHVPVVMFYPGKYDGQELILFGEIKDDNYYRAFKLVD